MLCSASSRRLRSISSTHGVLGALPTDDTLTCTGDIEGSASPTLHVVGELANARRGTRLAAGGAPALRTFIRYSCRNRFISKPKRIRRVAHSASMHARQRATVRGSPPVVASSTDRPLRHCEASQPRLRTTCSRLGEERSPVRASGARVMGRVACCGQRASDDKRVVRQRREAVELSIR